MLVCTEKKLGSYYHFKVNRPIFDWMEASASYRNYHFGQKTETALNKS